MFFNSGGLYGIATDAYEKARSAANGDREFVSQSPIISVVFAAASCEAFLSELAECATEGQNTVPAALESLAQLVSEAEKSRAQIGLKYQVARLALTGKAWDRGANPFQDFSSLIELRNSIVHLKIAKIEVRGLNDVKMKYPKIVQSLQSRNLLIDLSGGTNVVADWLFVVSTPAVARWACNAAANIVLDLLDTVPTSNGFTNHLINMAFRGKFVRVPEPRENC